MEFKNSSVCALVVSLANTVYFLQNPIIPISSRDLYQGRTDGIKGTYDNAIRIFWFFRGMFIKPSVVGKCWIGKAKALTNDYISHKTILKKLAYEY